MGFYVTKGVTANKIRVCLPFVFAMKNEKNHTFLTKKNIRPLNLLNLKILT